MPAGDRVEGDDERPEDPAEHRAAAEHDAHQHAQAPIPNPYSIAVTVAWMLSNSTPSSTQLTSADQISDGLLM